MALSKEIILENGITLNYHRIVSLNVITNINNIIEVASYVNESQREKEQEYQELQKKSASSEELTTEEQELLDKGINIYIETRYENTEYDETMSVKSAYEYLKTLPEFEGAKDI